MKKPDEDAMIAKEKATWQAYKDKRADDFKKLVSPDLVAMNANREIRGLTKLVKYRTIILLLAIPDLIHAKSELTADESIPIPKVEIDAKGNLQITASPTSSASDFDFLVGKWKMHNRHLNKRLENLPGVDGIRLLG